MKKKKTGNIIALLGPGFITAALVLGPGSLTVTSKIGANFQYQLFWLIPISVVFMSAFTLLATRIGVNSDTTLIQLINKKFGKIMSVSIGLGLFIVSASFQAGNAIGAGVVFSELFSMSSTPWIILFSTIAGALLFFKTFFKLLEKVMISMVILMLSSFLVTIVISNPRLSLIFQQFNFELPKGSELLSMALVASTFSIAGAFYQSYLVQEKGYRSNQLKSSEKEGITGIIILGIITSMVMLVAGSVLYPQEIQVNSAADMGKALEPFFGKYSTIVFMIGLFAASFSSLIGNATLGGVMISDALGLGQKLESKMVRLMIMIVIIIGSTVAIIFNNIPIQLIIIAQGVTIFIVPVIGLMIYLIALDKAKRGELEMGIILKLISGIGLIVLIILAVVNTYSFMIK